jgi:hypothetical protein
MSRLVIQDVQTDDSVNQAIIEISSTIPIISESICYGEFLTTNPGTADSIFTRTELNNSQVAIKTYTTKIAQNMSQDGTNLILEIPGVYLINIYISYTYNFSNDPTTENAGINMVCNNDSVSLPTTYLSNTAVDGSASLNTIIVKNTTGNTTVPVSLVAGTLPGTFVDLRITNYRIIATPISPIIQIS